jgi:hypothetical protein
LATSCRFLEKRRLVAQQLGQNGDLSRDKFVFFEKLQVVARQIAVLPKKLRIFSYRDQ